MLAIEDVRESIRRAIAALGQPLGGSMKVDLSGSGIIHIVGDRVDDADLPADCVVRVGADDFEALVLGQLNPLTALMTGRLRVEGDIMLARQLGKTLAAAREQAIIA